MTTLQTADGRLLRRSRPQGNYHGSGFFPPMWSSGERASDVDGVLASYAHIYRTQPVVASAIDKLSRRIATLPFDGYRMNGQEREVIVGDSLDSLIRHPLPRVGTIGLLHFIAQSLLLNGNALVAKVRGSDRDAPPVMLWPLDWSFVSAYAPQGGRIEWWSTTQFGEERFLMVEDTMHFAWQGPEGEVGVSPLEKLGTTIRLEDAIQRDSTAAFRNGLRMGGFLTLPPGNVAPEALAETRATLEAIHKGPDNSHKIGLAAPGADIKSVAISAVEAELIDQRRLNREEVGMAFDLSGPLMNDLTHGTYSNITELNIGLYRDVIPPWLGLMQEVFDAQLIHPEPAWTDRFVAFDLSDKLKGDPETLATTLRQEVEAGLITRNEARRILNLPPSDDPEADKLTASTNNQGLLGSMPGAPPESSAGDAPAQAAIPAATGQ